MLRQSKHFGSLLQSNTMSSSLENCNHLQEYASIGIPGEWIGSDESVEPTISKIGGFPKYFYLWQKTREQIECSLCHKKMYLLTQINAPLIDEASQRNIYVFMCCNSKCTKTDKGWKVIVQRGPKIEENAYFHYNNNYQKEGEHDIYKMINKHNKNNNKNKNKNGDRDSFWNNDLNHNERTMNTEITTKMVELNDDFSRLMAMQQKLLNDMDSKRTKKQKYKKAPKQTPKQQKASSKKGCFIPFEIAFNDEEYYKNNKNIKNDTNKIIQWKNTEIDLKKFLNQDENENNNTESDDTDDDEKEDLFSNYLERIGLNRNQCIRYCYGASPLLPYHYNNSEIPNCIHCGCKKVFEFQIMSTTLNYLEPKQIDHEWLTILVFVCPKTCQISDEQYVIVCNEV